MDLRDTRYFTTVFLRPLVLVLSFVVLQTALDFEGFPLALVVENVSECSELAAVQFDAPLASTRDVGDGAELVEDFIRGIVVACLDGGNREEILFDDRRPPTVFGYHRHEKGAFHRRLTHVFFFSPLSDKCTLTLVYAEVNNYVRRPTH